MNRTLLVSALLAIALTACGKKEQTPADAAAPAATAPAAAPATSEQKPADKKPEQKN